MARRSSDVAPPGTRLTPPPRPGPPRPIGPPRAVRTAPPDLWVGVSPARPQRPTVPGDHHQLPVPGVDDRLLPPAEAAQIGAGEPDHLGRVPRPGPDPLHQPVDQLVQPGGV